jgi:hypothetical protein
LLHDEETKNLTIRVQGTLASWNDIICLLDKIQGQKYTVTYESIAEAEAKEAQAWSVGNPGAARFALRRIMAQGNAKLPVVQNGMFPEVKITTDLEVIIRAALKSKRIPVVESHTS